MVQINNRLPDPGSQAPNANTADTSVSQKTVLVVDPERPIDEMLDRIATAEGWHLEHAPTNQAVLALMMSRPFDLVITGEKTSGPEDIDLLRKLRSVRPHIRMIILTEERTPQDVLACLRENAFSYFCAPFEYRSLADMVYSAMTEPCWDEGIEVISATPNWIRLMARCTTATADRLVQFLRQSDLPEEEKEDVATAAHEILLNAMEHGAGFDPSQFVEIGYLRTHRDVVVRVKDPGQGFSLDEIRHAAVSNSPGDLFGHIAFREEQHRRPGGFGILMAKRLVDEVIYGEHGNDVILIKHLDSSSSRSIPTDLPPFPNSDREYDS
jgi:anti-sigma regulatory factor (Ser/Thr protein kinase)/ActR/RegA family two-component response regulator